MKSGRAALFAQRTVRFQDKNHRPKYPTWKDFRTAFISEFCPKNEVQLALAKLETVTYHQARRSVDDYVDDFRELIEQAGYTEGLAIVVKFRRGLNKGIQDQIANIPIGRPSDDDPEAWYDAAIRADANRVANNLFHSGPSSSTITRTPGIFPAFPRPSTFTPPKPPPPPAPAPVPMDIDAARKRQPIPTVCNRCGKPGHWARDCERRFDIRYMLAEEREEWLQNIALDADTQELSEEGRTPEADPTPDFQGCSE
jgi:Retrotransposon gag protein/Zinc knuckle